MEARCYHQHCGLARALDRIGERWTLLIVRDLLLGPRRYSQLLDSLLGITTNLLAKRLKSMQEAGVIERSGRGPATRYRLTEVGAALEPAVLELARWGGRYMANPGPGDRIDLGWALLSQKRRYQGGLELTVGIACDLRYFELVFDREKLWVQEREAMAPQLSLTGNLEELLELLFFSHLAPGLRIEQRGESLTLLNQALHLGLS